MNRTGYEFKGMWKDGCRGQGSGVASYLFSSLVLVPTTSPEKKKFLLPILLNISLSNNIQDERLL